MKRVRKQFHRTLWSVLMTLVMLTSMLSSAAWANVDGTGAVSAMAKIESQLLNEISMAGGTTTFWVYFEGADLSEAHKIQDWNERGWYVYETLRKHAAESQAGVISDLEKAGVKYESFWIANTIKVDADYATLINLASLPTVQAVTADKVYTLIEPEKGQAEEASISAVEWGIANIKADQVWSTFGVQGEGIVVGSIDTGVQYDHPALVNQYRGNNGGSFSHAYSWHDPTGICGATPCDNNGHGTHVTGTMVGWDGGANQIGVAPGAKWIAAKGCEASTCSQGALLSSGQFMVAPTNSSGQNPDPSKRPHVLNNSWGGGNTSDPWYLPTVESWVAAGIFPQFANGNSGPGCSTTGNPGNLPISYAAGSYDINNNIASSSSRGPSAWGNIIKPNIAAPGVNIRSSVPGNTYANFSGTSMASPHVSGAIALMMSAAPSLIGDIDGVKAILNSTAIDTPNTTCGGTAENNNVFGEGRLDAFQAVDMSPRGPVGTLSGTVTDASSGTPVAGAQVNVQAGSTSRTASTNAAGQYSFTLPVGAYDMTVSRFGYASGSASGVAVTDGGTTTQNFALQPAAGGSLSGVVLDQNGSPVAGARVEILGTPIAPATADANGAYSFASVPNGTYQVRATAGRCNDARTQTVTVNGDTTANFNLPGRSDAFGYTCSIVDRAFETAANVVPVSGDDSWGAISLPFPVIFYGQTYNNAWVCTNGIVGFGTAGSCPFSNSSIPSTGAPNAAIYPFWDDGNIDGSASIRTELKGEAPNRRFVIEFRNATFFASSSRLDYNVVLYENGQIMTQYNNLDDARERGNSATVGIENHTGTVALQYSFNEDALYSGLSILYRLPPSAFIRGTVTDANDNLPVAGATVEVSQNGSVIRSVQTNDNGEYRVQVPLGDYTVAATATNYGNASTNVSLPNEDDEASASFSLTTARATATPGALTFLVTPNKSRTESVTVANTGSEGLTFTVSESGGARVASTRSFTAPETKLNPDFDPNSRTAEGKYIGGNPAGWAPSAPGNVIKSWTASSLSLAWGLGYDGNVWISDVPTANRDHEFTDDGVATGKSYTFNWGGSWIGDMANMGNGVMCQVNVGGDNGIYCWNTADGSLHGSITGGGAWSAISQRGLAYQPDGDFFYIGGWNQDILYKVKGLSHADKGTVVSQCSYAGMSISGLAYNPTAHKVWIASNSASDTMYQVDPDTCGIVTTLPHPTPGFNGAGLAMDNEGNLWASNQNTRTLYLIESGLAHSVDVPWLTVSPTDGNVGVGGSTALNVTVDTTGMEAGVYLATINLRTNSGRQANIQIPVTLVVSAYQQAVNVGSSSAYTDSKGDVWDADKAYTAGSYGYVGSTKTESTRTDIKGTDDDPLYQTARTGAMEYRFDGLEDGVYQVELLFADIKSNKADQRMFDVQIEDQWMLVRYDVVAKAGADTADSYSFTVRVSDGQLNIQLWDRRSYQDPILNAIRITHQPGR